MFESFFPRPKWFFISAVIVGIISMVIWYYYQSQIGDMLGLPFVPPEKVPLGIGYIFDNAGSPIVIGVGYLFTNELLTFYIYYWFFALAFSAYWILTSNNPWRVWATIGSATIIFLTWLLVQVNVDINYWNRDFYDLIQLALTDENAAGVVAGDFYEKLWAFMAMAIAFSLALVGMRFLTSHYVFRWRTAMNDYYTAKWARVRHIEGASQRIQEDTMRFAAISEGLGASAIEAVITLVAYLPILYTLSSEIAGLPIVGDIPGGLMWAAIFWALLGTLLTYFVGIRLPGLEFKNQRVEAAYRKELVYGEDDEARAKPPTLKALFGDVRKNYFRLYLNYTYFNFFRGLYRNADTVFSLIIFIPTFIAGKISFGVFSQTSQAFGNVANSFQYIYNSWPTVIELLSIRKRLVAFERAIDGEDLPKIDQDYLETHSEDT